MGHATRADIERVCEIAKVDKFLDELPKRYELRLGDKSVRLSGGQRQLIDLARALVKDADVSLIDEATSVLDSHFKREVQEPIESMEQDYAIIAIARRLSIVKNAHRIHTVNDGEIVESGTHEDLLVDDGMYEELYAIQSKG